MATIPNFLICEGGDVRGQGLFVQPLTFVEDYLKLPAQPGLGIDIDPQRLAKYCPERIEFRL